MPKLPAATLARLRSEFRGRMPRSASPGYDAAHDIFSDLGDSLGDAWAKPAQSPPRRRVAALAALTWAIPCDGLHIGVAVNQPALLPASLAAAKSLELPSLVRLLERARTHIPPKVVKMKANARSEWYETPAGQRHAAALETLAERYDSAALVDRIIPACLRCVLENPNEFFRR